MKPILYPAGETAFTSNGKGRLNPIMCMVTEERNGEYELEMDISIKDRHYKDIGHGCYISAIHDDTKTLQPFKIYKITRPMDGMVTVFAKHISYALSGVTVMPCTARNAAEALQQLVDNAATQHPFTAWTDKTTIANFKVDVPSPFRALLGGQQGSILDAYGGEFEFDGTVVKLHSARGTNSGVTIAYGKNLTDISKETDDSNVWTGVVPFWKGENAEGSTDEVVVLPEKVIYSSFRGNFSDDNVIPLDLSGDFDEKPTVAQLRARANSYITANALQNIPTSIDVSFAALWQAQEYETYASLERLKLCDRITVKYPELGVDNEAKIVKTVYDVLLEQYDSLTVGDVRTSLASAISATVEAVNEQLKDSLASKSFLKASVERATKLIQGGLGGNIVINTDGNGKPNEILCMDTDSLQTATNIIRLNMAGIGFSTDGGQTYRSAWTIDGHFVADFIDTGVLNAALITTGYMRADRIQGGTLTLGGMNNTNGELYVKDASGDPIVIMNNLGLRVTKGLIEGPDIRSRGHYSVGSISHNKWAMLKDGEFRVMDAPYTDTEPQTIIANLGLRDDNWTVLECLVSSGSGAGIAFSVPGYNQADGNGGIYGMKFYKAVNKNVPVTHLNGALFLRASGSHRGIFWDERSLLTSGKTNFDGDSESYGILPYKPSGNQSAIYGTDIIGGLYNNGNAVASSSSRRYKEDISEKMDSENDPHRLLALKAKQGKYKKEFDYKLQYADMAGKTVPMFIAEDVAEVFPSAVIHDKNGEIESWDERRIIPGMLTLIQEQEERLKKLEGNNDADTQA